MTFLHCLVEIKEIAVGGATYGIMYKCIPNNNEAMTSILMHIMMFPNI